MFSKLDQFRIDVFRQHSLDTIVKSEAVDETIFLGHRVLLSDFSMKGFTKLSGVTANLTHAEKCLRKMVDVYVILTADSWMESEIVFKDETLVSLPVKNFDTNEAVDSASRDVEDVIKGMMQNGWGYSDQIAYGNSKGFRKFMFTRPDWHGQDLISAVELAHTAAIDGYDAEKFFDKVAALAEAAVTAWNTMPDSVPTQNLFGAVMVDKNATGYAFGKTEPLNKGFLL